MRGIKVNVCVTPGQLLLPVADHLDTCWWYFGGNGVSLHVELPAEDKLSEQAWASYHERGERAVEELARWVDDTHEGAIGRPGFFSRYADHVDFSWTTHFASDAGACPYAAFTEAYLDWGDAFHTRPDALPPEILLMVRDIDGAYAEVFFREDWMFERVWRAVQDRPDWRGEEV